MARPTFGVGLRVKSCLTAALLGGVGGLPLAAAAPPAAGLPKGYELVERTRSPDGRYVVLFPAAHEEPDDARAYPPNLLVQVSPYKVLAEIAPGVPDGVTTDLAATWSGNQTVAIHHFRRWGLVGLRVYDLDGDRVVKDQDVLGPVREIFRADIRRRLLTRYPGETETIILVSDEGEESPEPAYRFSGRRLDLIFNADNKPNLAGGPHWSARLEAVWDLHAEKFTRTKLIPGAVEVRRDP